MVGAKDLKILSPETKENLVTWNRMKKITTAAEKQIIILQH